jgi:DNA-binding response OmpR family regulator
MSQRVLVVEDDASIRTSLRLALADEGWEVDETASSEEALESFERAPADVALVDLMLPGADGFACCRALRRTSDVPIIIVTARSDTHDVVAGLEAGADDYVTKPFEVKELTARMRAVMRRTRAGAESPLSGTSVTSGDLEVRVDEGRVLLRGAEVHLTRTEFRLLAELAAAPGRVFTRELLLERVWDYGYFGDTRLVDVHVRRLRTKIEDDPAAPARLVTVRGMGYRLDAT